MSDCVWYGGNWMVQILGHTLTNWHMYKLLLFLSETEDIFVWLAVPSKPSSQPIWLKV